MGGRNIFLVCLFFAQSVNATVKEPYIVSSASGSICLHKVRVNRNPEADFMYHIFSRF